MRFTVGDILAATGGRLLAGRPEADAGAVHTDTRSLRPGQTFLALRGDRFDGHDFAADAVRRGAACVVVADAGSVGAGAPGVRAGAASVGAGAASVGAGAARTPSDADAGAAVVLVRDTLEALADLGRAARARLACPVLAVTGSCGKTTVKEMLGQVLGSRLRGRTPPASYNNQVGVPLTLVAAETDDEFVLCEFGTSAPGEIARLASIGRPTVGLVTLVAPVHLEGLGSLEGVAAEKGALVESLGPGGVAVLNADDPRVAAMAGRHRGRTLRVGRSAGADVRVEDVIQTEDALHFTVGGTVGFAVPVLGEHQALLAAMAAAAAREVGVPLEASAKVLRGFRPPAMRLARVEADGVTVLNDAYNANPRSVEAALGLLALWPDRRKVFFCGDMRELGAAGREAHEALGRRIAEAGVRRLVCVGAESRATAEAAVAAGLKAEAVTVLADSAEAAARAPALVADGDVVLVKGSRAMRMERVVEALVQARKAAAAGRGR